MGYDLAAEYLLDAAGAFRKYREMAEQALSRVSDEQFYAVLDAEANSLAVLVKHMAGNLRSRWTDLLTTDGEKPDRDRDGEFEITTGDSREALMRAWDAGWARALDSLRSLDPADMGRTVRIRGEPHSLVQAIDRQLTHAAYHVGQIVLLAKHHRSGQWRSLSIPRGESRQFNAGLTAARAAPAPPPPSPDVSSDMSEPNPTPRTAADMVAEARSRVENLTPEQVADEIRRGARLVDIREGEERVQSGTIEGAVHAPRGMLEFWADPSSPYHREEFDPSERIILHCASGGRTALAADLLREMGYGKVAHLEGGIEAWKESGRSVQPPAGSDADS